MAHCGGQTRGLTGLPHIAPLVCLTRQEWVPLAGKLNTPLRPPAARYLRTADSSLTRAPRPCDYAAASVRPIRCASHGSSRARPSEKARQSCEPGTSV